MLRANEPVRAEEDKDDLTCCHRISICHPAIRDIIVTEPLSNCLGKRFTWAYVFHLVTNVGLVIMGWLMLYFLLGDTMLPKNDGFGLFAIVIFASWLGWCTSLVPYLNLPPIFGMLIAGIIVRNSGLYDIREKLGTVTASKIRTFCMSFVMIRAGLQLSITSLKSNPIFMLLLATVPSTIEMMVLAICCRYILSYPWDWSFMAGTIIGCMSPVVTVNCILALIERGYGDEKGLPLTLCTAACIDDVHIISVFSVFYSIVFMDNITEWWQYVPSSLLDVILGIICGAILGICFVFFPHRSNEYAIWYRMMCLVFGSLICTLAISNITISGAGYLASLVMSFVAMIGWRLLSDSFDTMPFRRVSFILWQLVQPIFVGIIGADIDIAHWSATIGILHLICIGIGIIARSATTYLLTLRTTFTWKERWFIVICWLPKGTLQAALGPLAYEELHDKGSHEQIELALDIVRLSVLTILFLAPIGSSLIMWMGPLLLEEITEEERQKKRDLSYLQLLSLLPIPPKTL